MDKVKEELKLMQFYPKLCIANYFQDLKQKVDLKFFGKEDEKFKYLEIINKIEQIEQNYYKTTKPFNLFNQEIELQIELEDLKYKIETKLFQDKSILFIEDFGMEKKTFLLILTNAYLRQSTFDRLFELDYFNRETLIAYFIRKQQFNTNIEELDAFNGLNSLKEIDFKENQITKIHSDTLNGLNNLEI